MASLNSLNVVLFQPEIPQNTGNIARTCAAAGAKLLLIKPLGFFIRDRHLKRAGLEYWDRAEVKYFKDFAELVSAFPRGNFAFLTKKASRPYTDIDFSGDLFLVFGKESTGLPEELLDEHRDRSFRIPTRSEVRSLNLASSVAVVVYEALRRNAFPGLEPDGSGNT